jgi:hypothetical protein
LGLGFPTVIMGWLSSQRNAADLTARDGG